MAKGRKALSPIEIIEPEIVDRTPDDMSKEINALHNHQMQIVEQFGDGLPWHPDHYEAAIRNEMRRGCESFIRVGRYLIVVRECALHGEWSGILSRLGMEPRQAQRMMEAAKRISAIPNASRATHLLEATGTQSKLIELMSLSDDELKELTETGSTGDLELDEIDHMTRDELRAAIKESRADLAAKDERISKLSDDLNKEHEKLAKAKRAWKSASPDEKRETLEHAVISGKMELLANLGSSKDGLKSAIAELITYCHEQDMDCSEFVGNVIGEILTGVRLVRDDDTWPIAIPIVNDGEA